MSEKLDAYLEEIKPTSFRAARNGRRSSRKSGAHILEKAATDQGQATDSASERPSPAYARPQGG